MAHSLLVGLAHFASLHGPIGLTEGGTLPPELLVAAFVLGALIWQHRRRRSRR